MEKFGIGDRMTVSIPDRLRTDKNRFILLKEKDKVPVEAKWTTETNYTFSDPKLAEHLERGGNYGVLCGPENLVVIDADDSRIRTAVESALPATFTVMTGRLGSHYYYKTDQQVATTALTDEVGKNIGHIKAGGGQVVGPSSLHPNGKEYAISKDVPVVTVRAEALLFALRGFMNEDKGAMNTRREEAVRAPVALKDATVEQIMDKYYELHGEPPGFTHTKDGYLGPHPVHGSTTGGNFHVNTVENYWYCFRCNAGGGPLSLIAVLEGVMTCEKARSGQFRGELFTRALDLTKKYGLLPSSPSVGSGGGGEGTSGLKSPATDTPSDDKLLPHTVAEELMERDHYVTSLETDMLYLYKDGVYSPLGEALIKDKVVAGHPEQTKHFSDEVCFHIRSSTHLTAEEFNPDPMIIPLNNGLLDIKTGKLEGFDKERVYTTRVPVTHVPGADCPKIKKFLSEVLRPEDIPVIQEIAGYCLYRTYQFQKAVMFTGAGANGKGVLLHLLTHFIGKDNVSAVSLQDLESNRFCCAEMYQKLANIHADLSSRSVANLAMFKMATGEDHIKAERKFGHPFSFKNYAKMLFSANKVPEIKEDTDAVYRRWLVIDFPNTFYGPTRDPDLLSKLITPEEMSGFLNWALEGLNRLLATGDFSKSQTTEEIRETYQRMAEPLRAFADDTLSVSPDSWISKEDMYARCMEYCQENQLPRPSKRAVGDALPTYMPTIRDEKRRTGGKQERGWRGVCFKENEIHDKRDDEKERPERSIDDYAESEDPPSRA